MTIETVTKGNAELILNFGIVPIKQMRIKVQPVKDISGGNSIGVSYIPRVHCGWHIRVMDPEGLPLSCGRTGLRPGDIIEKVNRVYVENAEHLSELVNQVKDNGLELDVRRGNIIFKAHIVPAVDHHDLKYRLGIWVRDSTAGVGTLTFMTG